MMKVKDEFEGKKARCPFCQGIVIVPSAEKPPRREESFDLAPARESEEDRPARRRRNEDDDEPRSRRRDERDDEDEPRRRPKLRADDDEEPRRRSKFREDDEDDRPVRRKRDDDDDEDRPIRKKKKKATSNANIGSIFGGLAMMLIAVLWFFGGLWAGYIFFYPPILFVVGIIALVKGMVGGE